MTDKRYKIGLEVITPLHVGTGNENDWIRGADYAQKKGKVYVIDIRKAVEKGIDIANLFVSNDRRRRNGIEEIDDWRLGNIAKYVFDSPQSTENDIKSCLRNQFLDMPIVAGSSIKGAVRSALFKHLAEDYLKQQRGRQQKDNQLVKDVFGDMNKGTDFMRFIQISDFKIPNEDNRPGQSGTILVNTKIFNLQNNESDQKWHGGWKDALVGNNIRDFHPDKFNTLYECIEPGKKGEGVIILSRSILDLLNKKEDYIHHIDEKKRLINSEISELFKVVNKATRKYLQEEEKFFKQYDEADNTNRITESIKGLLSLIPDENSDKGSCCLLKMSAGVGFHAITGNWIYEDFIETGTDNGKPDGKKNKKSRKIALYKGNNEKPYLTGFELMGFVMLRVISEKDAEYDKLLKEAYTLMENDQWQEAYKKINKAVSICPSRNEHVSIMKQCEKIKEEEDKKTEEQKKLKTYNDYIDDAKGLINEKKWIQAREKACLAEKLNIKQSDHQKIIEECDRAIKYSKSLSVVIGNSKSSIGNVIDTTKKWKKYHDVFGEQEYVALRDGLKGIEGIKEKNLRKERGGLAKIIGEDMVNRLFNELFPPKEKPVKEEPKEVDEEKEIVKSEPPTVTSKIEDATELSKEIDAMEPQPETKEGIIGKISKWFKNLF